MNWKNSKIAVVMGGISAEREVSLNSGKAVSEALNSQGINTITLDGVEELLNYNFSEIDAVFNILHGEAGENGQLAALLSCLKIPYTGTHQEGAVLSWNKDIAKTLVKKIGINTPISQTINHISQLTDPGSGPWIVKPKQEGSSVGLYYAEALSDLNTAIEKALKLVDSILVEEFIKGDECTVAIINNVALPVVKIKPNVGLYDYEAKYKSQQTEYYCPSGFDEDLENKLKLDALNAFKSLNLQGWARIDFIVDNQKKCWFLEANTTPGMTKTSLVPKAATVHGWTFNELVLQILNGIQVRGNND